VDEPTVPKIYTYLYFRTSKLGVLKMTEEFKHPTIGSIRGLAKDGLLQFLGVKYALLQDRFAEPELVSEYDGSTIDATKVG
jgi:carboxylesterase type B